MGRDIRSRGRALTGLLLRPLLWNAGFVAVALLSTEATARLLEHARGPVDFAVLVSLSLTGWPLLAALQSFRIGSSCRSLLEARRGAVALAVAAGLLSFPLQAGAALWMLRQAAPQVEAVADRVAGPLPVVWME